MADYQKMYVILCAAASGAVDELADIPLPCGAEISCRRLC